MKNTFPRSQDIETVYLNHVITELKQQVEASMIRFVDNMNVMLV
ncbi:MAG TPA: hypothetical protein VIK23_01110 [Acetobacterium sp.]